MLTKPIKLTLVAAVLVPSQVVFAQGVILQDFTQQSSKSKDFVLAPAKRQQVSEVADSRNLAADFADIGADPDQSLSPPANRITQPEPSARSHRNRQWLSASRFGCTADAYRPNPTLPAMAERRRATWYASMAEAACEAGVPVNLLDALVIAESRYNPAALSPKGAAGLAQLMPDSARRMGVGNVWDPNANLRGGARLLRTLLDEFGRFDLALAAYNAGAGRVRATGQVPKIPETVRYVSGILVTMRDQFLRNTHEPR